MRSGCSSGSIFWVLLVSGWFHVSETIIPEAGEYFLTPSQRRHTYPFGGLGLKWRALHKLGCCPSRLVSRVTSLRLARFPSATRNITLLPSAWGEKNPDTWSS